MQEKTGKTCLGYATTDSDEDEIVKTISALNNLQVIIADPLFKPVLKLVDKSTSEKIRFVDYPHEAFSGRIYRDRAYNLVRDNVLKIIEKRTNK